MEPSVRIGPDDLRAVRTAPISALRAPVLRQSATDTSGFGRTQADDPEIRPEFVTPCYLLIRLNDAGCPRHESNVRTRFRKPLLYPLSYGGSREEA
jgi:hypothetical protein